MGDWGQVWVRKGCGYLDQHSGAFRHPPHIFPPPECAPRSGHLLLRPGAVPVGPSPAGNAGQYRGGWRGGEAPGPGGGRARAGWEDLGLVHHLLFFLSPPRPPQALNLDKWVGLALGVTLSFPPLLTPGPPLGRTSCTQGLGASPTPVVRGCGVHTGQAGRKEGRGGF